VCVGHKLIDGTIGTNGIGTAPEFEEPVAIVGAEQFA